MFRVNVDHVAVRMAHWGRRANREMHWVVVAVVRMWKVSGNVLCQIKVVCADEPRRFT